MEKNSFCEEVWGRDDFNPLEIKVSLGHTGDYGSYLSGLPSYDAEELQVHYSYIKEYAKWAIENRVCNKCRFPWDDFYERSRCECEKSIENASEISLAKQAGKAILAYDQKEIVSWAKRIEEELQGDSEYARLNRKAREVLNRCIERRNPEMPVAQEKFFVRIFKKKTWINIGRAIIRWFTPSYWKSKYKTEEISNRLKPNSVSLDSATESEIKERSFSTQKLDNGNCCIRTKGGCIVVVPAKMVNEVRDLYKGGEIVAPIVKD